MVESDVQIWPATVKTEPHNGESPPKKTPDAEQLGYSGCLVDYGSDDSDTAEEPSPLPPTSSSVEVPKIQEVTTEDAKESQSTTTVSDTVAKRESPTGNGPKVCPL